MATAATPKGTTHNVSTPKVSAFPAGQAGPGVDPHDATGKVADAKATHNVSTPKSPGIDPGQRGPGESPHA
jgi:hypothetical protein